MSKVSCLYLSLLLEVIFQGEIPNSSFGQLFLIWLYKKLPKCLLINEWPNVLYKNSANVKLMMMPKSFSGMYLTGGNRLGGVTVKPWYR